MTETLQNARLDLRPFADEDIDELTAVFQDHKIRRYLLDGYEVPRSWVEEEVRSSRDRFDLAQKGEKTAGLWTIRLQDDSKIVGFAGFRPFFEPPRLQLIYGLLPRIWGQGVATEAAKAACDYG